MKRGLLYLMICLGGSAVAQTGMHFSQYIFNSQTINPAYFNHRSPISAQVTSRVQWMNYKGVPNTHAAMGQYNIGDHHTVGLVAVNDNIANNNTFQISGSYGYRLNLGKRAQLAFGARVGYGNQTMNVKGYLNDTYDPILYSRRSVHHFSIGAGIYAAGDLFFVGVSAPNLFNNGLAEKGIVTDLDRGTYHLIGGVKVAQTKKFMFYPTMAFSLTPNTPLYASMDLNFMVNNGLWLTTGVNSNIGVMAGIGYLFDNGLRFLYNYGFSFGAYNKFGGGTHEITIGYSKDLFRPEFSKRRYTNGKGELKSYRKQKRRYK